MKIITDLTKLDEKLKKKELTTTSC